MQAILTVFGALYWLDVTQDNKDPQRDQRQVSFFKINVFGGRLDETGYSGAVTRISSLGIVTGVVN